MAAVARPPILAEEGKLGEEADVLEGAGDAQRGHPVGAEPAQRHTVEDHAAGAGRIERSAQVEERRLAGAVGADQADDHPRRDAEGDVGQRRDPAKALRDALDLEERPRRRAACRGGCDRRGGRREVQRREARRPMCGRGHRAARRRPQPLLGRKSASSTKMKPRISMR